MYPTTRTRVRASATVMRGLTDSPSPMRAWRSQAARPEVDRSAHTQQGARQQDDAPPEEYPPLDPRDEERSEGRGPGSNADQVSGLGQPGHRARKEVEVSGKPNGAVPDEPATPQDHRRPLGGTDRGRCRRALRPRRGGH